MTMTASGVFLAAVLGCSIAAVIVLYFSQFLRWIDRSSKLHSVEWLDSGRNYVVGPAALFGALAANLGTVLTSSILTGLTMSVLISLGYILFLTALVGIMWIGTAVTRNRA